jgi:hypothetical protein
LRLRARFSSNSAILAVLRYYGGVVKRQVLVDEEECEASERGHTPKVVMQQIQLEEESKGMIIKIIRQHYFN